MQADFDDVLSLKIQLKRNIYVSLITDPERQASRLGSIMKIWKLVLGLNLTIFA